MRCIGNNRIELTAGVVGYELLKMILSKFLKLVVAYFAGIKVVFEKRFQVNHNLTPINVNEYIIYLPPANRLSFH